MAATRGGTECLNFDESKLKLGFQVCDQAGRVNCIIPTPNGKCANLTFGGPNLDVVYAACATRSSSAR